MQMQMLNLIYASILVLLLDIPWLIYQGTSSQRMVSSIQGTPLRFRTWAAIPVYIALGYLLLQQTSAIGAAMSGVSVYAVYEFTNLAIFDKYPLSFVIQDTVWGGVLFYLAYILKGMLF